MATPQPASSTAFESALTQVELALEQVGTRLVQGDALALQGACAALQQAMLDCSRVQAQGSKPSDAKLQLRLNAVHSGVAQVRESMARRAAAVQRALQTLLPCGATATYGRNAAVYGRASKAAASFTSLSA